jgi:hypothetical protein
MALAADEKAILDRLQGQLKKVSADQQLPDGSKALGLATLDSYYNGVQKLLHLGLAVPPELRAFITIVNWCRLVVNAIEERIDLEGFRLPGAADADDELWRVWQANDLDEESQLAHVDALVYGRSYVCVGSNEEDPATPLITVESPLEMTSEYDPRNRRLSAAAKFYTDSSSGEAIKRATLYLPNATIWLFDDGRNWVEEDRDTHNLGRLPVVALTHRSRLGNRSGQSHILDAITVVDAAARALTNAQVATEVAAIPHRWVAGMTKGDFVDPETEEPLPVWETYFGAIAATANENAKFGQFSAADLANFTRIVDHYAQILAGMYGLPLRYFGQSTTNPPSADGIRADEARLVKSAERFERSLEGGWEEVMRLVKLVQTGTVDPDLTLLETLWRDPATPTKAQQADAAVKLFTAKILPLEAVWEELGYSAVKRDKLKVQFQAQQDDPLLQELLGGLSGNSQSATDAAPAAPPAADQTVPASTPGATELSGATGG